MLERYLANYQKVHTHPLNHLTHAIGIPMIVISLPVVFFSWRWGLGLFVVGWIFQFIGHAIEGKPPAFMSDPLFLVVGPLWLVRRLFKRSH